jgi:hypothetical protein
MFSFKFLKDIFVKTVEVDEMEKYKSIKPVAEGNQQIISYSELRSLILEKLGDKGKYCIIQMPDSKYYLPPVSYVKEILEVNAIDKKKYVSQSGDCDDFSYLLKSLFIKLRLTTGEPMAFGIIHGMLPTGHSINFFLDDNKQLHFIEPQSDRMYSMCDTIKVAWFIYI